MGLFSTPTEKRTQLYFRDDGKFVFRKLDIEDTFLAEKNKEGAIVNGWKHFYKNQFPFPGGMGIAADMVTLSFSRDIILDPYGIVKETEKPTKGFLKDEEGKPRPKSWLVEVGKFRRLKMLTKRGQSSVADKVVWFLGAGFAAEMVIIGILVLMKRGA